MQEHFYAVLQQKRVFRKENGSGSAPRDKNLNFVHFDVIIQARQTCLQGFVRATYFNRNGGLRNAKRRATQVADKISILSRFNVIYNDRFIINCFFNYPNLYTKISPRKFAGIKNYLLSSSVSSADYNQQMKKLHYRNGESRDVCHGGG